MKYKQVILVREDLKLPRGKMSAQVSHASVDCVLKSDKKLVEKWKDQGGKTVKTESINNPKIICFKEKSKAKTDLRAK